MSEQQSKERKQAEAAFLKEQIQPRLGLSNARIVSTAEENTARQKAARLARNATEAAAKKR